MNRSQYNFRISPELLKAVQKYAKKHKTDVTSVIVAALTQTIKT